MGHYTDLAFRYIKMKKVRSILTVLGVSISVMLLYIILNLGWSYVLNERADIRKNHDYEIVLFTENEGQIEKIGSDKHIKDYTVAKYYKYDYYSPVEYENAMYINTTNPYRMDAILEKFELEYGVSGIINDDLAQLYLQGSDGDIMHALILVYFLVAYIFAIFGVGIIRNSIQLTLFEQVKDFGNLRCIGSTKKQMENVIFWQGAIIEALGIIVGIMLGTVGSLIGGLLLEWSNTGFHILPVFFVVLAFMFDLYFAMKENAKLVTGMSPLSAIRGEYRVSPGKTDKHDKLSFKKNKFKKEKRGHRYLPEFLTKDVTFGKKKDKDYNKQSEEAKTKKRRIGLIGFVLIKLCGVEGEYAYKNLMRAPGRFFKVVTVMIFGVAAVIVLSCGALSVLRYDEKIQDMYGYYPVFVSWDIEASDKWSDVAYNIPYKKLDEEFKDIDSVTDAKRIYTDSVFVEDFDKDIECYLSDDFLENTQLDAWRNDIKQEVESKEGSDKDSMFYQNVLMNIEHAKVMGYDERDLARCEKELVEGTVDVSENGIIVVQNIYMHARSYSEEDENNDTMFQQLEMVKAMDCKLGDQIRLIDMAEFRKRIGNLTSVEERKKIEEYKRERNGLYNRNDGFTSSWEEDARNREEELSNYIDEYNYRIRKKQIDILEEMRQEGVYKTYTVEGILRHNPNGEGVDGDVSFIVPASHFHDVVGREDEYFSGMMYHFEPFSLRQYEKVDWMGIWDELSNADGSFGYMVSDYAVWESEKHNMRNMTIAAVLIVMFIVSMIIINYFINVASNIYMRRKEFAQLRVIGVSKKGLFKMVMLEGVIASLVSCVVGVLIGAGLSYVFIVWITRVFMYADYVFPWIPAIISVVVSVLLLCGAVYLPLKHMGNDVAEDLATAGE